MLSPPLGPFRVFEAAGRLGNTRITAFARRASTQRGLAANVGYHCAPESRATLVRGDHRPAPDARTPPIPSVEPGNRNHGQTD